MWILVAGNGHLHPPNLTPPRCVLGNVKNQRLLGITSLTAAAALLAALAYEPANIATVLELQNVVDEGTIVLGTLALVAAGAMHGTATLRRPSAQPAPIRTS
jgi:hypothetical protein